MPSKQLTHLDAAGNARMVDVGEKDNTRRMARARGEVLLQVETIELMRQGLMKKGDVLTVAQVAGIQAAKKTAELIPLCHGIPLHGIAVELLIDDSLPGVKIEARVSTIGKTGAEMEALTAVSVAALTVYDMIKAVEKRAVIQNIRLVEKSGGKSGHILLGAG